MLAPMICLVRLEKEEARRPTLDPWDGATTFLCLAPKFNSAKGTFRFEMPPCALDLLSHFSLNGLFPFDIESVELSIRSVDPTDDPSAPKKPPIFTTIGIWRKKPNDASEGNIPKDGRFFIRRDGTYFPLIAISHFVSMCVRVTLCSESRPDISGYADTIRFKLIGAILKSSAREILWGQSNKIEIAPHGRWTFENLPPKEKPICTSFVFRDTQAPDKNFLLIG